MSDINRSIVQAARVLSESIAANYPETDTRLLARRVQELVQNTISASTSASIVVTASDVLPKVNVSADILAAAHAMYVSGDKENASRLVVAAFNEPDCYDLMTSLAALNEEADPDTTFEIEARINKGELDDSDIYGDKEDFDSSSVPTAQDAVMSNPGLNIDAIVNHGVTTPNDSATDEDTELTDALNIGRPPNSLEILSEALTPQNLGDETGGGIDDAVPGYDDNSLTNVQYDPSNLDLDPANWNVDSEGELSDDLNRGFEPDNAPLSKQAPGDDNTAAGDPHTESDYGDLDSEMGLIPTLDPQHAIIAFMKKVKDPAIKGAINIAFARGGLKSLPKIKAFVNAYAQKQAA